MPDVPRTYYYIAMETFNHHLIQILLMRVAYILYRDSIIII